VKPATTYSKGISPRRCCVRNALEQPRHFERRRHERFVLSEPVTIRTSYSEMIGSLLEISRSGGTLDISSGFVPGIGTEMALTLGDNKYLWARACRVEGGIVAIEFPLAFDEIEDLLRIEQRGVSIYVNRKLR
jgi:hypothetical protein